MNQWQQNIACRSHPLTPVLPGPGGYGTVMGLAPPPVPTHHPPYADDQDLRRPVRRLDARKTRIRDCIRSVHTMLQRIRYTKGSTAYTVYDLSTTLYTLPLNQPWSTRIRAVAAMETVYTSCWYRHVCERGRANTQLARCYSKSSKMLSYRIEEIESILSYTKRWSLRNRPQEIW